MDIMEDIAPAAREQVRNVLRPDTGVPAAAPAPIAAAPAAAAPAAPAAAPAEEGFFNPFG